MESKMNRTCPDCSVALVTRAFQGIVIDACPRCAGIFFDEGEVNDLKAKGLQAMEDLEAAIVPQVTIEATADKFRLCPNCQNSMDKFRYMYHSDVVLDECGKCGGIWVQDGELGRMREVLQASGVVIEPKNVNVVWASTPADSEGRMEKVQGFLRSVGRKFQRQSV